MPHLQVPSLNHPVLRGLKPRCHVYWGFGNSHEERARSPSFSAWVKEAGRALWKEFHAIDNYTLLHESFPHMIPYIGRCHYSNVKLGLANAACTIEEHIRPDGSPVHYFEPTKVVYRVFCLSADRHFARFGFPLIENGKVSFPLYLHSRYVSEEYARPEPFYEMTRDRFRALHELWEEEGLGIFDATDDQFIDDEAYVDKYLNSRFHSVMMSIGRAYLIPPWRRVRFYMRMRKIAFDWLELAAITKGGQTQHDEGLMDLALMNEELADVEEIVKRQRTEQPFFPIDAPHIALDAVPTDSLLSTRMYYNWDTLSTHDSEGTAEELSTCVELASQNSYDAEIDLLTVMPIELRSDSD